VASAVPSKDPLLPTKARGREVRPIMTTILVRFSDTDEREFQASDNRISVWAKRHDKSHLVDYVSISPRISKRPWNTVASVLAQMIS
jgi:hypothetical protein